MFFAHNQPPPAPPRRHHSASSTARRPVSATASAPPHVAHDERAPVEPAWYGDALFDGDTVPEESAQDVEDDDQGDDEYRASGADAADEGESVIEGGDDEDDGLVASVLAEIRARDQDAHHALVNHAAHTAAALTHAPSSVWPPPALASPRALASTTAGAAAAAESGWLDAPRAFPSATAARRARNAVASGTRPG